MSSGIERRCSHVLLCGQVCLAPIDKTIGLVYSGPSLVTVGLSQHLLVGDIAQFERLTVGAAVLHRELARPDKMLTDADKKGNRNPTQI